MAGYEIGFDERRGYLICRILETFRMEDVKPLCAHLSREWIAARDQGPVRLLWDHRGLSIFPDNECDDVLAAAFSQYREGDRAAVLVSHSLHKVQGKHKMADWAAFFLSENAAATWLNVGIGHRNAA